MYFYSLYFLCLQEVILTEGYLVGNSKEQTMPVYN